MRFLRKQAFRGPASSLRRFTPRLVEMFRIERKVPVSMRFRIYPGHACHPLNRIGDSTMLSCLCPEAYQASADGCAEAGRSYA